MADVTNYLILFADLIDSTDVAVEVNPSFYAKKYVASYHWAVRRAMEFVKDKDAFPSEPFSKIIVKPHITGDEALSFTPLDTQNNTLRNLEDIAASAVAFAYVTKLFWLASPYNVQRMLSKQFPRDVAVGIHIGPAESVPQPPSPPNSGKGEDEQIASLHINITKRIENAARDGSASRIFASFEVDKLFEGWLKRVQENASIKERSPLSFTRFMPRALVNIKGVPKKLQLFELTWPTDNTFNRFLELPLSVSSIEEAELTKAAPRFAETFMPYFNNPFSYNGHSSAVQVEISSCATRLNYVEHWFKAVNQLNMLFFNECWLLLNCYFISYSLLRYKEIDDHKHSSYFEIVGDILSQYKSLITALTKKQELLR